MVTHSDHIHIESCTSKDYTAIAAIYNEHILRQQSTMDQELKTAEDIRAWVDKMNEREGLYVIKQSGICLGWGIIKRYSEREGYRYTCETAIYLKQDQTRKGYGSRMKKFLIDRCQAMGYHHLVAKIFAVNTGSIEYNKRLGYEIVGRQKEIGMVNGQWMDVVIMQYLIDHPKHVHQHR